MKKAIALILAVFLTVSLCGCSKKLSQIASEIENILPDSEEIVEVKYEEFILQNPQMEGCYSELDSKQKDYYSRIYAIAEDMTEGYVDMGEFYEGAVADVSIAYNAFLNDNAEIFWMPNTYVLATTGNKMMAIAFECSDKDRKSEYAVSKSLRDSYRSQLDKVVKEVMAELDGLDSEYEKEKYINDYICDNVSYNETAALNNTSYGALVLNNALCEGYARAFKLLCNRAGIECALIVGESQNTGHMWNRVNIDRKHSFVDVTWNDREDYKSYAYFNITDEQIKESHSFAPLLSDLDKDEIDGSISFNFNERKCSFTGNTFYEQEGFMLWQNYADEAAEKIEDFADMGETYTEFMFATERIRSLFEKNPEKFLTEIQMNLSSVSINSYSSDRDTVVIFFE